MLFGLYRARPLPEFWSLVAVRALARNLFIKYCRAKVCLRQSYSDCGFASPCTLGGMSIHLRRIAQGLLLLNLSGLTLVPSTPGAGAARNHFDVSSRHQ